MSNDNDDFTNDIKVQYHTLETIDGFKYSWVIITDEGSRRVVLTKLPRIAQSPSALTRLKPLDPYATSPRKTMSFYWLIGHYLSSCTHVNLEHSLLTSKEVCMMSSK